MTAFAASHPLVVVAAVGVPVAAIGYRPTIKRLRARASINKHIAYYLGHSNPNQLQEDIQNKRDDLEQRQKRYLWDNNVYENSSFRFYDRAVDSFRYNTREEWDKVYFLNQLVPKFEKARAKQKHRQELKNKLKFWAKKPPKSIQGQGYAVVSNPSKTPIEGSHNVQATKTENSVRRQISSNFKNAGEELQSALDSANKRVGSIGKRIKPNVNLSRLSKIIPAQRPPM